MLLLWPFPNRHHDDSEPGQADVGAHVLLSFWGSALEGLRNVRTISSHSATQCWLFLFLLKIMCVHVCAHVHTYVHAYVFACACMSALACMCMCCACLCVCVRACVPVCDSSHTLLNHHLHVIFFVSYLPKCVCGFWL